MIGSMTPLEETAAYKELVGIGLGQGLELGRRIGLEQGMELGMEQGLEQGRIVMPTLESEYYKILIREGGFQWAKK